MSGATAVIPMASRKSDKLEIRAEPEWVERVKEAAAQLGLPAAGYIRMVVTQRMDLDGVAKPPPAKGKPKG